LFWRRKPDVAASLAEGIPDDLRDALTGLNATNIGLVAQAVLHAGGQRTRSWPKKDADRHLLSSSVNT
jgi:hypothetical protein